jgi:tetratricopeptide (TPR) repeat protein
MDYGWHDATRARQYATDRKEFFVTRQDVWKAAPSWAQEIPGYRKDVYAADPREMALIPGYCAYTLLFRDASPGPNKLEMFNAWKEKVGDSFVHMHHYCAGLIKANRATLLARDRDTRQFLLNDAVIEYDYVITRVPETYILLPEMKKGEALLLLNRGPVGVYYLEQAIELKPDYWPPYAKLADYYQNSGNLRKARETLEAGIAKAPDAQALVRRLESISSKP